MQNKRTPKFRFGPVLFFMPVILILIGAALLVSFASKNAELILLVAPSTATIKLDGRKITSGTRAVRPGSHKLEISGDGLEPKTIEFDIAKHETKTINCYIADNNFDFYRKNEAEIERLALVADDSAKVFINNYLASKAILELLPLSITEDYGAKSSTLSVGEDCERSFCLKITDDNAELRPKMESKIAELGFDINDYEIKYERTDSLEEWDEDEE